MKFILASYIMFILPISAVAVEEWCSTAGTSAPIPNLCSKDTVKAVTIYAVSNDAPTQRLPSWYKEVFTPAESTSIPAYFRGNSQNRHNIFVDVYGKNGLDDTLAFKSDSVPASKLCCQEYSHCTHQGVYALEIFRKADEVINFGNYDRDNDGSVDMVFFVSLSGGGGGLAALNTGYRTKDVNSRGDTVSIYGFYGFCIAPYSKQDAINFGCHEYAHLLFGEGHAYGWDEDPNCSAQGTYNVLGNVRYPPPPLIPTQKLECGWVTRTLISQSVLDQPVRSYYKDNELYEIKGNLTRFGENFWVTHYYGEGDARASVWEQQLKGHGLLIWHVDRLFGGGNCNIRAETRSYHKSFDIECAHGLYDYTPTVREWIIGNPNDSSGKDSLDVPNSEFGQVDYAYTSPTIYWNDSTKTFFDILSNPSSDGYRDSIYDSLHIQNLPSYIGVSNIRGTGTTVPMTVDFLINNRVGHIDSSDTNTTWKAGTYTINGDLTIDSNDTLTIKPGAIVKITPNRDRMSAGVDVKKPEIIVKGTLKVEGTAANPVKFISFASAPSDTDWYGIRVLPGGSAKIKHAQIKHAYIGVSYENSAIDTVANCLFDSNKVYGVKAFNNNLVIRNSSFKNMPIGWGLYSNNYSPKIENNYFDNLKYGVSVSGAAAIVTGNKFVGTGISERAISCDGGSAATVSSDTVQGNFNNTYIESYKSYPLISNCVLGRGDTALSSAPVGVKAVISSLGSTPTKVRTSNIWGYTSKGIYGAGGKIDIGNFGDADPGYNNIHTSASGTKSVWNTSSTTLYAETNWWGQAPPPSSLFQGTVDRTPYLLDSTEAGPAKLLPHQLPISDNIPKAFAVSQNYPNPFNPATVIEYSIPVASKVSIKIYNILGQVVKTLVDENKLAGTYSVIWDGTNSSGKQVTSGVYFYLVKTDDFKETKKMTLIR